MHRRAHILHLIGGCRLFALLLLAPFFVTCTQEGLRAEQSAPRTVVFRSVSDISKTVIGAHTSGIYPSLWTDTEIGVTISQNWAAGVSAVVRPLDGGKYAEFSASMTPDGSGSYKFFALSPLSASKDISESYGNLTVEIPAIQTSVAPTSVSPQGTVDPAAMLVTAVSGPYDVFPTEVLMDFHHITAYMHVNFQNLNLDGAKVDCINFAASTALSGRWYYYPEDHQSHKAGEIAAVTSSVSKTVMVKTTVTDDVWLACAPVDLSGTQLKISVYSDKGVFAKTVTLPSNATLQSGHVASLTVDMNGIAPAPANVYSLVRSGSDLTVGDKVLIASRNYNFAMGQQKSSNRAGVVIVKNDDRSKIYEPDSEVAVFTLAKGASDGSFAFKCDDGYLYAASNSANQLKTKKTLDAASSFSISISGNGKASIVSTKSDVRGVMSFNPLSSNYLFSCYSSLVGGGALSIFKYGDAGSDDPHGGGDPTKSPYEQSCLARYEIPSTDVTLTHEDVFYNGNYCHSTAYEEYGEAKACIYNTSSARQRIVTHNFIREGKFMRNYSMLYDYDKHCPLWVAAVMNIDAYPQKVDRSDGWCYDPAIPSAVQPNLNSSYKGDYDRGHVLASGYRLTTEEENHQTFYYSNMTPQNSTLNRGKWGACEIAIRDNVVANTSGRDSLYFVSGPIFSEDKAYTTDPDGMICPLPSQYYICIMKCTFSQDGKTIQAANAAAYLFDHYAGATRQDVTVDQVEALTGFDFFCRVPAELQAQAESTSYPFL